MNHEDVLYTLVKESMVRKTSATRYKEMYNQWSKAPAAVQATKPMAQLKNFQEYQHGRALGKMAPSPQSSFITGLSRNTAPAPGTSPMTKGVVEGRFKAPTDRQNLLQEKLYENQRRRLKDSGTLIGGQPGAWLAERGGGGAAVSDPDLLGRMRLYEGKEGKGFFGRLKNVANAIRNPEEYQKPGIAIGKPEKTFAGAAETRLRPGSVPKDGGPIPYEALNPTSQAVMDNPHATRRAVTRHELSELEAMRAPGAQGVSRSGHAGMGPVIREREALVGRQGDTAILNQIRSGEGNMRTGQSTDAFLRQIGFTPGHNPATTNLKPRRQAQMDRFWNDYGNFSDRPQT
jgi:hypothetical protein